MRPFLIWAVSDISIFFSLCVINYGKHFCEIRELKCNVVLIHKNINVYFQNCYRQKQFLKKNVRLIST